MLRVLALLAVLLAAVLGGGYLAWSSVGWLGALAVLLGAVLVAKLAGGAILRRLFAALVRAKGAALRNAGTTVHTVTPTPPAPPANGEAGGDEAERRKGWRHFLLEATITPAGGARFGMWEPGELFLCPFDARPEDDHAGRRRAR
jgi:hypothetical protein